MNKQQLASKIWESANKMRSKIEANEYKDYILGFIFYKFLSDKEIAYLKSQGITDEELKEINENDKEVVKNIQDNLGYFIAYENLFTTWISKGKDFNIKNVRDALSAFSRLISSNPNHKKVFTNIFRTLDTGLSKLGDSAGSQTKAVSDLLNLIKDIPMDGKQDYDVLGFIYEYLISMFAANAGKKAGEFYTPHEVSVLMAEIVANHIKDHKQETFEIYDPTSGSGSLLITIGKALSKHINKEDNIKYYAQELIESTYNLTRMNLVMRGINPSNIVTRNGDTLEQDWPFFDESDPESTYDPLYVDAVVSNPPYSQHWDPTNKGIQPRYEYGLAPASKADYAFLLHDLYHIKPSGIMTIVLPHGVLFRGKAGKDGAKGEDEYEIRKNLIENNKIDTIIGLPANIFFGTGIPTIIMVLRQNRDNNDVLIIDASKHFSKSGKQNKLLASDIKRIIDVVTERKSVEKFSRVVSKEEIRNNDYNLNIPRYVDSSEDAEYYDIFATVSGGIPAPEIEKFEPYWKAFPILKNELFNKVNDSYYELRIEQIKEVVLVNKDVKNFEEDYKKSFETLKAFLKSELINNLKSLNVNKEEDLIAQQIFDRLQNVSLVDKYEAYQSLDDEWQKIAIDLEIISTEGIEACRKVEPNLVMKGKEEVQDGWKGRIMDFALVQKMYFASELQNIEEQNRKLEAKSSELAELIPETEEGEEEIELTDEQKKQQKNLTEKIKTIRKEIIQITKRLEENTIKKIETLTDDEVKMLLEKKWITPLVDSLNEMPCSVVADFIDAIKKLTEKYAVTLTSLNKQIETTQNELFSLMGELTGNDFDIKGLETLKSILGGN
ncbi:type I restriction-modification system subunit M [uncultured Treponema sp.]|uniref:type I restriction-modification system subunit M n=1 Tax=uncultured Treponema sp. TaxID=162155 RepID=UPI002599F6C1|nr:type I restriction-modification system subunit M [uncultured Treponema sp.]